MDQRVSINVLGETITFETQVSAESAEEVARFVERRVQEVHDALGTKARMNKVAVMCLASMQMASEYIRLKEEHETFKSRVDNQTRSLLRRLDGQAV
ncbi:MAG: cell division protein ZapA [Desulfatibacillaceae bacterium]